MTVRRVVITIHKWLGLAAALLWIVQAATGVFIVFHWEIDDAIVPGAHHATDFASIERHLPEYGSVHSIWTTAGFADRYDVSTDKKSFRIDGAGNVLRVTTGDDIVYKIVILHQSLLAGDKGRAIIGVSGLLVFTNLLLGVIAGWPRVGQWRRALEPLRASARIATLYSWHRALGLWLCLPAMCIVAAGVLLAFEIGESDERPPAIQSTASARLGMAGAIHIALARYPDAEVSGIAFPSAENALWSLTLKQRGEWQRAYGKTLVYVSAIDGHIVRESNALTAPTSRKFFNELFPFHTGEIAGFAGRTIVLLIGCWLLTMMSLGIALWRARRV